MGTASHFSQGQEATLGLGTPEAGSLQAGSGQRPRLDGQLGQASTSSLHLAASASGADTALRPRPSVSQAGGWAEVAGGRDSDL